MAIERGGKLIKPEFKNNQEDFKWLMAGSAPAYFPLTFPFDFPIFKNIDEE